MQIRWMVKRKWVFLMKLSVWLSTVAYLKKCVSFCISILTINHNFKYPSSILEYFYRQIVCSCSFHFRKKNEWIHSLVRWKFYTYILQWLVLASWTTYGSVSPSKKEGTQFFYHWFIRRQIIQPPCSIANILDPVKVHRSTSAALQSFLLSKLVIISWRSLIHMHQPGIFSILVSKICLTARISKMSLTMERWWIITMLYSK